MNKWEMNVEELREMFLQSAQCIVEKEPYLTEIDSKSGDGDHGIGMAKGFSAVMKYLPDRHLETMEDVFRSVGNILLETMGGASGVIFGTFFISGTVKRLSSKVFTISDFAHVWRGSLDAIKQRGKANIGDKTMIDALEPAVVSLEQGEKKNVDLEEGFRAAAEAARKGMEYTREISAKIGRAKYYKEKSIGIQDAGATSVWILFQSMADWISINSQ